MSTLEPYALLTIGAGPAALSAVQAYRRIRPDGRVAMIAGEHRVPYLRPALSKELLRGEVSSAEIVLEPEDILADRRIELIAGQAAGLDPTKHTVTLSGGRVLPYRQCLLASGAEPVRLDVPGADDPGVRTLRSIDDLRELHSRMQPGMRVVVVGSGFIGCEIASSLSALGHPVLMCSQEAAPNISRLGEPPAVAITRWLEADGIELVPDAELTAIERQDGELRVITSRGSATAGAVIMATGISPRAELAVQAGAPLDAGAVPADQRLQTCLPDVLAAGDVANAEHVIAGRRLRVEHWGDALAQGDVAGRTAAGEPARWTEIPGFWSEIAGRTIKYAGWGDGYDEMGWEPHPGGFTARYHRGGQLVAVLTHESDDDYEHGRELMAQCAGDRSE